jgi:DNA polymerase-4
MNRCILHLDVDAFFASVEQRDNPALRGKPVAVGSGVAASCSYESRRWGVRTGMRLSEARRLCPSLLVLPGDYRKYEQAAKHILAICLDRTPLVEVAALDDLYLDLSVPGRSRLPDGTWSVQGPVCRTGPTEIWEQARPFLERTAEQLRRQVREEVGLSTSVGMGASKLVAKVATKQAKPGGQVAVPWGGERDYLASWPVTVLPGVGPRVAERLERLNVRLVSELAVMPPALLGGLFGKLGRTLHQQANGIDPRPVLPRRLAQSVSRHTSFEPATGDRAFLRAMLRHLLERACSWLRVQGLATRGLAVTIRYGDHRQETGRVSFRRAVERETELHEAAADRLDRLYQRRLPLRLLGVDLSPLTAPDRQPSLFPDPQEERERKLAECKDAIRKRFGFMAVQNGTTLLLGERLEQDRENFRLRTPCLTR